ncbi:MAG: hypothetical protein LBL66_01525 [Clostridiales bacterium]|nr:hypothetical protein [Clostridiales bacterium]
MSKVFGKSARKAFFQKGFPAPVSNKPPQRAVSVGGGGTSAQCTVHSPQFRSGGIARGVAVFGRDCRVALTGSSQ